jgi:hypothetical protein
MYFQFKKNLFHPSLPCLWPEGYICIICVWNLFRNFSSFPMLYVTIHVKIYLTNLIQYVNLNCVCRRLDQNNITGSLDLRNINISGPLNLINLARNNMGPDFTSFLLYPNISNLLSSGLSIMWVPFCNSTLLFISLKDIQLLYMFTT